jgi:hypothetical protein
VIESRLVSKLDPSEDGNFWLSFLRSLVAKDLTVCG